MKKHKICKILLVILAILLCVAFYELLGICIAYKKQPEVSNTTKKETKNGSLGASACPRQKSINFIKVL